MHMKMNKNLFETLSLFRARKHLKFIETALQTATCKFTKEVELKITCVAGGLVRKRKILFLAEKETIPISGAMLKAEIELASSPPETSHKSTSYVG